MKKSRLKYILLSTVLVGGISYLIGSNKDGLTMFSATTCVHNGYHYSLKNATTTQNGSFEFWTCCKCNEHFLEKPSVGTFTDSASIYSGGTPADVILPAGTKFYGKGTQIAADSSFDPKVNDLSSLDNMAISFDFKIIENGTVGLALFDSNWANVTGTISFTKNSTNVTSNVGEITSKENGWYNITINRNEFTGDGLSRATNISIVAGLWGGSATVYNTVSIAVNWASFAVVEAHKTSQRGNDALISIASISSSELTNKALSFDAYFGSSTSDSVKFSIYKDGWDTRFLADIFVKHVDSRYEVRQFDNNGTVIPSVATELGNGWVNIKINAEYLEFEATSGNKLIVWANPTTADNGVDSSSFRAVSATVVSARNYEYDNANIQTFSNIILMKNLISSGAYTFNVKMNPNVTSKVSFMNGNWSNFGTSYFVSDASGNISCYFEAERANAKGKLTRLSNGWTNVIFNEYDFAGDGRSADGAEGINYIFVENGNISFDENSCSYCGPYLETGISFATNVGIDKNSWDGGYRNFSYTKNKVITANDTAVFAFDFKPVGNGTISFALLADTWANITDSVNITVSNSCPTTDYTNGVIIERLNGWYSIYLPAPFVGDGINAEWTPFAKFYSAHGYSGTSFTINFGSIHLASSEYLGGQLNLERSTGYSLKFDNIGASYYLIKDNNDYRDEIKITGNTTDEYFTYTPEVVGDHSISVEAYNKNNCKISTSKTVKSVTVEPVFCYAPFSSEFSIAHADIANYGITEELWQQAVAAQGEGKDRYFFFLDDDLNWTINGALATTTEDYSKKDEVDFSNSPYLDRIMLDLKQAGHNVLLLHSKYTCFEQYCGWSWWTKSNTDNCLIRYMNAAWKYGMKCIVTDSAILNGLQFGTTAMSGNTSGLETSIKQMVTSRLLHSNNSESNLNGIITHKAFYGFNVPDEPFYNSRTIYAIGYASQAINNLYANNPAFANLTKPIVFTCLLPYAKGIFSSTSEYQQYIEQWLTLTQTNYFNFDLYNYTTTNYGTSYSKKFCPIKDSYNIFQTLRSEHPGLQISQTINCGNIAGCQVQTTADVFACHLITAAAKFNGYGLFTFSQFDTSGEWENEATTVKLEHTANYALMQEANEQVVRLKGLLGDYSISSMTLNQNPTNGYGSGTKKMTVNYQNSSSETMQMVVNYETDVSASANFNVTVASNKQYIMFGYGENIYQVKQGTGSNVSIAKGKGILIF